MILDKSLLSSLIKECSIFFGISQDYVEKDYWAISLLKTINSKRNDIVFKGGTCLSKCFKVINRFSEDIDISLCVERLSYKERKILAHENIQGSIKENGLIQTNPDNIRSRRWFNRYLCEYDSISNRNSKGTVILELAMQSPSDLFEVKECQTFVGEYLDKIGEHDKCVKYGLDKFEVKVQKLERTFVDKVYAICDYQISKNLQRNSRHIYDLHNILPLIKLDEALFQLFLKVREYRVVNPTCYAVLGNYKLYQLIDDLIKEETFKNDFNDVTSPLLYDETKYNDCVNSLIFIKDFLKKNDF